MDYDPSMLNTGRQKQLLLDDLVIESAENIRRTWHEPKRVHEGPLIKKDQPWEHTLLFMTNTWQVIRDSKDNLFKCWYVDWDKPEIKPGEFAHGNTVMNLLYAESEDGIHWRKPSLGIHRIDDTDTNVVLPGAYVPGIVLDPDEPDPAKRFKILTHYHRPGHDSAHILAATSADGIYWTVMDQPPVIGRHGAHLDDVIIMRYDPHSRLYIMTTRHYDMYAVSRNLSNPVTNTFGLPYYPLDWRRENKRRIWQSESADFVHWSQPYSVLTPDDNDNLDETYGGLCPLQVGDLTVGFLESICFVPNTMHVRLTCSRNSGKTWRHLNNRQPFLAPRGEGTWDAYGVTIPSKPIVVDDELWVYYGGCGCHHDWWITGAREGVKAPEATDINLAQMGLGLAKLRLDGFACLEAGYERPGILITRPLISDGNTLVVNARCRHEGSIAAEIVDVNDAVLPGFSRQECDVFTADSVRHIFSWKGKTDIPVFSTDRAKYPEPERERFRKIRFFMENAELYSFHLATRDNRMG